MLLYGIMALFALFVLWYLPRGNENRRNRIFICGTIIILFLMAFLKKYTFGSDDLSNYYRFYSELPNKSYSELWRLFLARDTKDVFFYIVSKFFADRGISAQCWVGLIGLLYGTSIMCFVRQHMVDGFCSCLMLFSLSYLPFSFTALRQTVAMSITLFAFEFAKKRKIVPFILIVLLAALFHSSALIFILAYFAFPKTIHWPVMYTAVVFSFIICSFFPDVVRRWILMVGWNDQMMGYATVTRSLSYSGFIIQLAILLFCWFLLKKNKNTTELNPYLVMMVIGLCFQSISTQIAEAFRLSMYFSIGGIVAVPMAIGSISDFRIRKQYITLVYFLLIVYFVISNPFSEYYLFWS